MPLSDARINAEVQYATIAYTVDLIALAERGAGDDDNHQRNTVVGGTLRERIRTELHAKQNRRFEVYRAVRRRGLGVHWAARAVSV